MRLDLPALFVAGLLLIPATAPRMLAQSSDSQELVPLAPQGGTGTGVTATTPTRTTSSASRSSSSLRSLRQLLPDPDLLDGSKSPPDKYPDYGMLGEFELPGSDVDQQQQQQQDQQVGAMQKEEPQQTAGGAMAQPQDQKSAGSAQTAQQDQEKAGGGGTTPIDQDQAKQAGNSPGQNDPNAKAEGVQVGQLKIDESAAGGSPVQANENAQNISIGDSAMVIHTTSSADDLQGTKSAGDTQQADRQMGGKAGTVQQSNRGVERGETMPEGL